MDRNEFIDKLYKIGTCELKAKGGMRYLINEEMLVDRSDGTGHHYDSWDDLFAEKTPDGKTIGNLVDNLRALNTDFHYHFPMTMYDENGDKVIE